MIIISFYPKYLDPEIKRDEQTAAYRAWLETHGDYGRLFMWNIGAISPNNMEAQIIGVRIFQDEIATLFKLMFDV
jgi:hypothetical protein